MVWLNCYQVPGLGDKLYTCVHEGNQKWPSEWDLCGMMRH